MHKIVEFSASKSVCAVLVRPAGGCVCVCVSLLRSPRAVVFVEVMVSLITDVKVIAYIFLFNEFFEAFDQKVKENKPPIIVFLSFF